MRKITFLVILFLSMSLFAQDALMLDMHGNFEQIAEQSWELAPCSQFNPSNDFEAALSNGITNDQIIANDLFVQANEVFSLEQVVANLTSVDGVTQLNVIIWDDLDGKPNTILFSELEIVPSSQIIIGVDTLSGLDVYETTANFPSPYDLSGGVSGATYWIQIDSYPVTGTFSGWEYSTATMVGYGAAFNHSGEWGVEEVRDGVYMFNGDCNLLNVDEFLQSAVSVLPNPASDRIMLNLSQELEVLRTDIFDITGKLVLESMHEVELDISKLQIGLYLLKIETTQGSLTKKVIKK